MSKSDLWVVIPAYNEEHTIAEMLQSLQSAGFTNLLVVDDGSSDRTAKLALQTQALVVKHAFNRGVGAATQTGISLVLDLGAQVVVTIDADCQHDVNDIKALVTPILNKEVEVTIGTRFVKKAQIPAFNKIANKFGNLLTWLLFGLKVSDSQSGFKAFSRKAAQMIRIHSNGFESCSEIIREIGWYKLKYREVPINVNYTEYSLSKGQSLANGVLTVLKLMLRTLMR